MKLRLLKKTVLRELSEQIENNLDIYRSGNFDFIIADTTSFFETDLEIDTDKLAQIQCSNDDHEEITNCRYIYESMNALTLYLARDERIWVHLTHTNLLNYTRTRWPIPTDNEKALKHIKNHFFVNGARGFERDNSASRLWWMAHLCNRIESISIDEALAVLLYQSDVRANIIERPTTAQSLLVFKSIIMKLHESYQNDKAFFDRDRFRLAMKRLNLHGGVKLLDSMNEKDIATLIEQCFI